MTHPRDLKIAKRLKHALGVFFHQHESLSDITIEEVIMTDRKNAQIFYQLSHDSSHNESTIIDTHTQIEMASPQMKKHIAQTLNLKAIPKLSFCITIHDH